MSDDSSRKLKQLGETPPNEPSKKKAAFVTVALLSLTVLFAVTVAVASNACLAP